MGWQAGRARLPGSDRKFQLNEGISYQPAVTPSAVETVLCRCPWAARAKHCPIFAILPHRPSALNLDPRNSRNSALPRILPLNPGIEIRVSKLATPGQAVHLPVSRILQIRFLHAGSSCLGMLLFFRGTRRASSPAVLRAMRNLRELQAGGRAVCAHRCGRRASLFLCKPLLQLRLKQDT